jgi:hypothetical protein
MNTRKQFLSTNHFLLIVIFIVGISAIITLFRSSFWVTQSTSTPETLIKSQTNTNSNDLLL